MRGAHLSDAELHSISATGHARRFVDADRGISLDAKGHSPLFPTAGAARGGGSLGLQAVLRMQQPGERASHGQEAHPDHYGYSPYHMVPQLTPRDARGRQPAGHASSNPAGGPGSRGGDGAHGVYGVRSGYQQQFLPPSDASGLAQGPHGHKAGRRALPGTTVNKGPKLLRAGQRHGPPLQGASTNTHHQGVYGNATRSSIQGPAVLRSRKTAHTAAGEDLSFSPRDTPTSFTAHSQGGAGGFGRSTINGAAAANARRHVGPAGMVARRTPPAAPGGHRAPGRASHGAAGSSHAARTTHGASQYGSRATSSGADDGLDHRGHPTATEQLVQHLKMHLSHSSNNHHGHAHGHGHANATSTSRAARSNSPPPDAHAAPRGGPQLLPLSGPAARRAGTSQPAPAQRGGAAGGRWGAQAEPPQPAARRSTQGAPATKPASHAGKGDPQQGHAGARRGAGAHGGLDAQGSIPPEASRAHLDHVMDEVGRFDEGGASRHSSTDDPVAGFGATGSSLHKTASRLNEFTRPLAAEPSALEVVEALPAPQAQPLEKVVRESERVKVPPEKLRTGREGDADAPARAADAERTRRGSALASDDDESVASDVAPATRPTPVTIQRTEAATGSGALASLSPTGAAAKRAQGESKHAPVAAGAAAAMQAAPRAAPAATTAATTAAHRAHDAASTADSKPVVPAPRAEHAAPPKHTAAAATVHTPSKSESSQATPRESKDSRKSVTQAPAAPAPAPAPAPAASARALEEDSAMPEAITVDELKQRYQMLDMVGEGAYGMVMKCRSRESGVYVAIKEFKVDDTDPDAAEVRRTALREVRLLRMLQHPNVVRYIDGFMVSSRLFISMEYVPRNVLELLEAQPSGHLDRATVRSVMYQLICAIEFIHRQGIIYRDIKPENLLIDNDGRLKLCDFGFARRVRKGDVLTDYVATRWYRAPELLLGPPFRQHNGQMWRPTYDAAVDMWAIGCLMGELTDGEPLFPGDSDVDQMHRIQQMLGTAIGEHVRQFYCNPQNKGAAFKPVRNPTTLERRYRGKMGAVELDLMSKLLHMDPARRITGKEALKHPYFKSMDPPPM